MCVTIVVVTGFNFVSAISLIWKKNEMHFSAKSQTDAKKSECIHVVWSPVLSAGGGDDDEVAVNGRNNAPNMAQFNTIPDKTNKVPRQPYSFMKKFMSGEKINVPSPDPATAIPMSTKKKRFVSFQFWSNVNCIHFECSPVATDRYFSKYIVTLTIAGK